MTGIWFATGLTIGACLGAIAIAYEHEIGQALGRAYYRCESVVGPLLWFIPARRRVVEASITAWPVEIAWESKLADPAWRPKDFAGWLMQRGCYPELRKAIRNRAQEGNA